MSIACTRTLLICHSYVTRMNSYELLQVGIGKSITFTFLVTILKEIFPFSKNTVTTMIRKRKDADVAVRDPSWEKVHNRISLNQILRHNLGL